MLRRESVLIVFLGGVLLAVTALDMQSLPRVLLGVIFVLFVPGYLLQTTLFPQRDTLTTPERFALSFVLSIALIPPLALLLDASPIGFTTDAIISAQTGLVIVLLILSLWSRSRVALEMRFGFMAVALPIPARHRWLYGVMFGALGTAFVVAAFLTLAPTPSEEVTAFYMLGGDEYAEDYPHTAFVGESVNLVLGITNTTSNSAAYRVEVYSGTQSIGSAEIAAIPAGETRQLPVTFSPIEAGENVPFRFLLYQEGEETASRTLQLWLRVEDASR